MISRVGLLNHLYKRADDYCKNEHIMNETACGFYGGIEWAVKKLFKMELINAELYLDKNGNVIKDGFELMCSGKRYYITSLKNGSVFEVGEDGGVLNWYCYVEDFDFEKARIING